MKTKAKQKALRAGAKASAKSRDWEGFHFFWIADTKEFRVTENDGSFNAWYSGDFEEAKLQLVIDIAAQLARSVDKACEAVDKMRECMADHQLALQRDAARLCRLRAAISSAKATGKRRPR